MTNRVDSTISILDYGTLDKVADITGLLPGPDDMELSADRRYLWVTFRFARHVGVIDLTTRKLVDTIAVGRSPHGISLRIAHRCSRPESGLTRGSGNGAGPMRIEQRESADSVGAGMAADRPGSSRKRSAKDDRSVIGP